MKIFSILESDIEPVQPSDLERWSKHIPPEGIVLSNDIIEEIVEEYADPEINGELCAKIVSGEYFSEEVSYQRLHELIKSPPNTRGTVSCSISSSEYPYGSATRHRKTAKGEEYDLVVHIVKMFVPPMFYDKEGINVLRSLVTNFLYHEARHVVDGITDVSYADNPVAYMNSMPEVRAHIEGLRASVKKFGMEDTKRMVIAYAGDSYSGRFIISFLENYGGLLEERKVPDYSRAILHRSIDGLLRIFSASNNISKNISWKVR